MIILFFFLYFTLVFLNIRIGSYWMVVTEAVSVPSRIIPYPLHKFGRELLFLITFPHVRPYWSCVGIFTLLSFYITCFCLGLILVYWCAIILVFFYLFWSFHVFILTFFVFTITPDSSAFLVSLDLVCDGVAT